MNHTTSQSPDSHSDQSEVYSHADSAAATGLFARRTALSQAAFFLPHLRPGMSLVDCGCGPGTITVNLAEIVVPDQVVGIDIDAGAIESAQALAA